MSKQQITESVSVTKWLCDVCGGQAKGQCRLCSADLCREHTAYDDRDYGDYPDRYCAKCWKVGERFRAVMAAEEDRHFKEMEDLAEQWKAAAQSGEEERV